MSKTLPFTFKGVEYRLDLNLAHALDSITYNLKNDWDFVILITGDRKVRVGKSVLAIQISSYLAWSVSKLKKEGRPMNTDAYSMDNVFFDNKVMVDQAQKMPPYSIIHYDEAREGLAASKAMKNFQQDLIDFFNECGQLNHIFIIVCPDYFELRENISVGRSEFLINVYRKERTKMMDIYNEGTKRPITVLERGHFEFFDRKSKQLLYDIAKSTRRKSYGHVKALFLGDFSGIYTLDEEEYRQKKRDSLSRFKERHKENKSSKDDSLKKKLVWELHTQGLTANEISEVLEQKYDIILGKRRINEIIQEVKTNKAEKEEISKETAHERVLGSNYTSIPPQGKNDGEGEA